MTQTAQAPKLSDAQEIRTVSPMRSAGPMRSAYLLTGTVLPALMTAALLLTPLVVITAHRFSLIGMTEESTGYRYFYSLRYLYTENERPWVPQGQAMTIVHMAVQLLLTAVGYSPIELRPRMDLFVVSTVALPHMATAVALVWAVLPLRSLLARLAVVGTLLLVSLGGTGAWDRHLLLPDYYSWIHTLAIVALGCCLRFANAEWRPTRRWTVGLGVFAGVCLGLKVTLLLLAVAPVLLWLRRQPLTTPRAVLRELVVMGGVAIATFGVILIVAHAFSPSAVLQFFLVMLSFDALEGHREGTSLPARMADALMNHPSMVVRVEHVALLVQVAGLALLRNRMVSAATVAGAFLSLMLLAVRDTPTTLVEIGDGVMISTIVWVVVVGAPQLGAAVRGLLPLSAASWVTRWGALGAQALLCVGLFAVVIPSLNRMTTHYLDIARLTNANERQLNAFTSDPPGEVAILTVSNEYHPYTSDSAIFKGGTNIAQSSIWGVSGLVRDIVPNRHYYSPDVALIRPIDLAPYEYLLFVSREPRERLGVTVSLIQAAFSETLTGFDCPIQLPNPEDNGLQYACKRTPDAPLSEHTGEIAFVPSSLNVLPKFLAFRRDGDRRALEVGEAVYSGNTREIWRLNEDWTFTRLRGQPGETRMIPSVGAWSAQDQALSGLTATFDGVHWQVPSAQHVLNTHTLTRPEDGHALPGWEVVAPASTTVRTIPDRRNSFDHAWLQLRARTPSDRIGMRTVVHLDESLTGSPIGAILTIRHIGAGQPLIRLASWDGSALGPPATQSLVAQSDGAHIYHLRLEPEQIIGTNVELLVELTDPVVGDSIEIQDAKVIDGRYP